jgi:hypothetical protein
MPILAAKMTDPKAEACPLEDLAFIVKFIDRRGGATREEVLEVLR